MGIYGIFLDRQIAPDRTGQELDGWSLWPAYVRPEQQPHAQHFEIRSFRKTEAVLMKEWRIGEAWARQISSLRSAAGTKPIASADTL